MAQGTGSGASPTTVCLFLPTGKTFTFRNAYVETDNETMLVVSYTAMSDGKAKRLIVQKSAIVGYAVTLTEGG